MLSPNAGQFGGGFFADQRYLLLNHSHSYTILVITIKATYQDKKQQELI